MPQKPRGARIHGHQDAMIRSLRSPSCATSASLAKATATRPTATAALQSTNRARQWWTDRTARPALRTTSLGGGTVNSDSWEGAEAVLGGSDSLIMKLNAVGGGIL